MHMNTLLRPLGMALLGALLAVGGPAVADDEGNPLVHWETDLGDMVIELFPEQSPKTVENFLRYVEDGFYNGTIFHRVIPGFVVQGGGMTYDFTEKEVRDPIPNESDNGLRNNPMTLSMARRSDPDSATSQFFINLNRNTTLDAKEDEPGYAVFGRVIRGQETVIDIVEEPRGDFRHHPDAPNTPVRILRAQRLSQEAYDEKYPEEQDDAEDSP